MGMRTNSNIRHTVTNGPFAVQICQRCKFVSKKKNLYWIPELFYLLLTLLTQVWKTGIRITLRGIAISVDYI